MSFITNLVTLRKKQYEQQKSRNARIQICFPKKWWVMFVNYILQHSLGVCYLIKKFCVVFLKSLFWRNSSFYHTVIPNNLSFISHHSMAFVFLAIQKSLPPSFQMSIFCEIFSYLPNYMWSLSSALHYNYVYSFPISASIS